jgi:tripartite ATP-independent transporter DctP family solute receptor
MRQQRRFLLLFAISLSALLALQLLRTRSGAVSRHLILAHAMMVDHPVHFGMERFAEEVHRLSAGKIKVSIYPNGQLGSVKDLLELVQLGGVSMTMGSSLSVEAFSPLVGILNLPFLYRDKQHYFEVLDSAIGEELLEAPVEKRIRGLAYYDAGDRSFYANRPIRSPADLKGLKLRVMENATAIRMVKLLGGSPTPMPYGEVYTALQQGVIDGAENNITALTVNRHGEVSKFYSKNEHIFAPDILIISEQVWAGLTDEERRWVRAAADASKLHQRSVWQEREEAYEKEAREVLRVNFIHPDKEPFRKAVEVLHQEFAARGEDYRRLIEAIRTTSP